MAAFAFLLPRKSAILTITKDRKPILRFENPESVFAFEANTKKVKFNWCIDRMRKEENK